MEKGLLWKMFSRRSIDAQSLLLLTYGCWFLWQARKEAKFAHFVNLLLY